MNRLSNDLRELFIDTLPDGIVAILSNHSQNINNQIYYDQDGLKKIKEIRNQEIVKNVKGLLKLGQLEGFISLEKLELGLDQIGYKNSLTIISMIANLPFIQRLDFGDNLTDEEAQDICPKR